MKIFGVFDQEGNPKAFYNENIHGEVGSKNCMIPDNAIEIDYQQWLEFITNNGERQLLDGKVVKTPNAAA